MQTHFKLIETLVQGYSSESTQRKSSNVYYMTGFKWFSNKSVSFVRWTKVVLALEGLNKHHLAVISPFPFKSNVLILQHILKPLFCTVNGNDRPDKSVNLVLKQ